MRYFIRFDLGLEPVFTGETANANLAHDIAKTLLKLTAGGGVAADVYLLDREQAIHPARERASDVIHGGSKGPSYNGLHYSLAANGSLRVVAVAESED